MRLLWLLAHGNGLYPHIVHYFAQCFHHIQLSMYVCARCCELLAQCEARRGSLLALVAATGNASQSQCEKLSLTLQQPGSGELPAGVQCASRQPAAQDVSLLQASAVADDEACVQMC